MRSPSAAGVPGDRIVELSADGIALFSTDGRLLWHNPAFAACSATAPHEGTGFDLLLPLPDDHRPPGFPDPTLAPAEPFRDRYGPVRGRYYDLTMQRLDEMGSVRWLCIVRDVTAEVGQREKLLAIQRAGRELSRLTPAELARMSTAERTDLLKANIIQYSS
ncbi:MAG TPA: PAS domain-containing protein, partial [Planctomycetia bacterium]|nr:PAS domain-containing protein [Planctomycetia bacterium]